MAKINKQDLERPLDRYMLGKLYSRTLYKYPELSSEEQDMLVKEIKETKSEVLCKKLFFHNMRFAVGVCNSFAIPEHVIRLEDLISGGLVGLWKAIERVRNGFYDNEKANFISYAVHYIYGYALSNIHTFHPGVHVPLNSYRKLGLYRNEINKRLNRDEVVLDREKEDLIFSITNKTMGKWMLLFDTYSFVSLFEETQIKDWSTLPDVDLQLFEIITDKTIPQFDNFIKEDSLKIFNFIFENILTPRESEIIKLSFGFNAYQISYSNDDIASYFLPYTRERIRQIKNTAINKIKTRCDSKILQSLFYEFVHLN